MRHLIGIDIGGTKVAFYVLSERLSLLKYKKLDTNKMKFGSIKLIDNLISIIKQENINNIKKVGISINAAVYNNMILKSSVLGVENFPLADYIKSRIHVPVEIENDVVAFTKAEAKLGYGKRYKCFAVLNIGTGTRICLFQNGNLVKGYRNMAGEISQLKVYSKEFNKYFILDNFISGRGISNIYKELTGRKKTTEDIFKEKNSHSVKAINIFKENLVRLFESIAYFYNPEAIILTGSVFDSSGMFLADVLKKVYSSNFDFFRFTVHKSKIKYANVLGVLI